MRLAIALRLGDLPTGPADRRRTRAAKPSAAAPVPFGGLTVLAREVAPDQLPALLGRLVEAAATALMRLNGAGGNGRQSSPTNSEDRNLSADEAARRLGVSKDYLYRTKLPFKRRIGRRVVFSEDGLERWNRQRSDRS